MGLLLVGAERELVARAKGDLGGDDVAGGVHDSSLARDADHDPAGDLVGLPVPESETVSCLLPTDVGEGDRVGDLGPGVPVPHPSEDVGIEPRLIAGETSFGSRSLLDGDGGGFLGDGLLGLAREKRLDRGVESGDLGREAGHLRRETLDLDLEFVPLLAEGDDLPVLAVDHLLEADDLGRVGGLGLGLAELGDLGFRLGRRLEDRPVDALEAHQSILSHRADVVVDAREGGGGVEGEGEGEEGGHEGEEGAVHL